MAFTMELDQFISGERFQALADVSVIPYGSEVGESDFYFVKDQQTNNNYNVFYYTGETNIIPDYVQNAKIIFVNTWTIEKFSRVIFPQLKGRYIFISHNSDLTINQTHKSILDDDRVITWFSQNIEFEHPKLFALPIGLGNQQYPHGDLRLLQHIIEKDTTKDTLVYKNFNIDTNRHVRYYINETTTHKGIPMHGNIPQSTYFEHIARSKFVISPPGNGPDCHRVWECLYLKTIPIIQYHQSFSQFKHLPIFFINDWNEFDLNALIDFNTSQKFTSIIPELTMNYWKEKILQ